MTVLNLLVVIATVSTINLAYGLRLQRPSILSSRLQPKEASKSELQTTESTTDLNYDDMTVVRLREILRERGLPVSGLKGVLTSRLSEFDASHEAEAEEDTHDVVNERKEDILDLLESKEQKSVVSLRA
jgi:SAP domain